MVNRDPSSVIRIRHPGSRRDPEWQWDGQQPITLTERHDAAGVFLFRKLPCNQAIAQRSDFVSIEIADRVTKLIRARIGTRNQAV